MRPWSTVALARTGQKHVGEFSRVSIRTIPFGYGRFKLVYVRGPYSCDNGSVDVHSPSYQGSYLMSKTFTIILVLIIGYILGVKFPGIAGKFGLA